MFPLFSLLGFDFSIPSLALVGLSVLIGFIIGATLKHSLKIVVVLVAVMVIIGVAAPSVVSSLSGVWTLVDPTLWLKEILNMASVSIVIILFFVGLFCGLYKG